MKSIKISIILLMITQFSFGQIDKKFNGEWLTNKSDALKGEAFEGVLSIGSKGASFNVLSNQMYLAFTLKQKGDTLYMYYDNKNSDYGRLFTNPTSTIPNVCKNDKSLFAKCIINKSKELQVVYKNRKQIIAFNNIIKTGENQDVLSFPPILYSISKNKKIESKKIDISQKNNLSNTNTKKYCDGLDAWYYLVTINQNKIIMKCFADKKNKYHKNKTTPTKIYVGTIINGEIIISGKNKDALFKLKDNKLYDYNVEGGGEDGNANEYILCN
jgi:hypothetical protein